MSLIEHILLANSIRFLFFEKDDFAELRDYFSNLHYTIEKFISCSYCNGFWVGLVYFTVIYNSFSLIIAHALICALTAFYLHLAMKALIDLG